MKATHNFENALKELTTYLASPVEDNRDRSGIIQAFEFTFEQAWKSIQKIAGSQGVSVNNPKAAFSFAMSNRWIRTEDELNWLSMIKDCNLTSHTYHEDLAKEVHQRIENDYLKLLVGLLDNLKTGID